MLDGLGLFAADPVGLFRSPVTIELVVEVCLVPPVPVLVPVLPRPPDLTILSVVPGYNIQV